jgi:hypothetical protein
MTRDEKKQAKLQAIEKKRAEDYYADDLALPPECDVLCPFRQCYHKYHNKGSYTPGRGYTQYYQEFRPVCGTRMAHGCQDRDTSANLAAALEWARLELSQPGTTKADRRRKSRAITVIVAVKNQLKVRIQ